MEILPIEVSQSGGARPGHPRQPQLPPSSAEMSDAASKVVEAVTLEDSYWTPILLNLFALLHFLISAVLIASYWHFRVWPYTVCATMRVLYIYTTFEIVDFN